MTKRSAVRLALLAASTAATLFASVARAQTFGAPGQVVVSGATSAGISLQGWSNSGASEFGVNFDPAVDYFVARNLSLGVNVGAGYSNDKGYNANGSLISTRDTSFSGGLRLRYNIPLGERFSLWPKVEGGAEWVRQSHALESSSVIDLPGQGVVVVDSSFPTTTLSGPYVDLFVPILYHPAPHFFIGIGPEVFHVFAPARGGFGMGGQRTMVDAVLQVGAYFGGGTRTPGDDTRRNPNAPPAPRFGDDHEFVVTSDINMDGGWLGYASTGVSSKFLSIEPGFDYFVGDHVSLGAGLGITYGESSSTDVTTGAKVSATEPAVSVAPRIGYDIRLAPGVSLWPRLFLGIGELDIDRTSGVFKTSESDTFLWTDIYAPVLVHPAPHVFLGLGPYVYQELFRSYSIDGRTGQNAASRIGVAFTMGGWM